MSDDVALARGHLVRSPDFGQGRVEADHGATVIVRFDHGLESCTRESLSPVASANQAATAARWHPPLAVVARAQAEAIRSVNDTWGVFARSRIALLPHQLWVCRRVLETWPARWLIADDVGLGKTIEAGLVLMPLLTRNRIKRLLIVCPASLVEQWQQRLREMFDIRLARYVSQADTTRADFWATHDQVVASLQTLRDDRDGRHQRMLEADAWDLLIVDEAHHLNADEHEGPTLGYRLVKQLIEERKVTSRLFFTGTPHRGKNFGFLSLMQLVAPEVFDPKASFHDQLAQLSRYVIRNNKQNVTDLKGERLFRPLDTRSQTYSYSPLEAHFYEMLTDFITTGKAYAGRLNASRSRTAMLVLIAMQKLASSSVAAIRRALEGRLARLATRRERLSSVTSELPPRLRELVASQALAEREVDLDGLNEADEALVQVVSEMLSELRLMEDEEPRLRELVDAARAVTEETKVKAILRILDQEYADRAVLFFTEYKATQSLLMSALIERFGDRCVAFINGDERADGVVDGAGNPRTLVEKREAAAKKFNEGTVRFLVSTEAGGEGIDLQERSYSLVHVDLPWNPMRMHQRVGRLNRYGQTHPVSVISLHNPDTVESRIWEKLNEKIAWISQAFGSVMDEPEDLLQLVLGMTSPTLFRDLFADAAQVRPERLSEWFDEQTAQFGGRDVIETVKQLVGNCARFDFQQISSQLPPLDLPALRPFVTSMLVLNNRRATEDEHGALTFHTPDAWQSPALRPSYNGMVFDRQHRVPGANARETTQKILGVGHRVVDLALEQAIGFESSVATVPAALLRGPLFVFRITDQVTGRGMALRSAAVGVGGESPDALLRDADLLLLLNGLSERLGRLKWAKDSRPPDASASLADLVNAAESLLLSRLHELDLPFVVPESMLVAVLWPSAIREATEEIDPDAGPDSPTTATRR